MSIQTISRTTEQFVHEYNQKLGGPIWLPRIASNVSKVALPALALYAMSNIPGASAGPAAYALCVEACFAGVGWWFPPAIPVCVAACLPLLVAPTP